MRFIETLHIIERIDALIQRQATGTPYELCDRLNISRSTWFELLKIMKEEFGCPIAYCKYRLTYYYTEKGRFEPGKFVR